MRKKLKDYVEKCLEFIITHIVWYIVTSIASFIALNIPKIFTKILELTNWFTKLSNAISFISVALLISSILFLIVSLLFFKKSKSEDSTHESESEQFDNDSSNSKTPENITQETSQDTNCDLLSQIHFKKITITMKFDSCSNIEYVTKYDGNAIEDGVECFEKQLSWSGTKYISTNLVSNNIDAHIDDNIGNRTNSPYIFHIYFDEDISIGDKMKFTTKTLLSDETKCMIPLSSFCVKYHIDELVLKLSAPIGLLHTVRKKCYKDVSRKKELYSSKNIDQEESGGYKTYTYTIPNPKPWLFYALEWKFSEQY